MDQTEKNIRDTIDRYDLSRKEAEAIERLRSQPCQVCGRPMGKVLHPRDHHHLSGMIRDVICLNCNIALGHVEDSPQTLRRLAEYLERPPHFHHSQLLDFDTPGQGR